MAMTTLRSRAARSPQAPCCMNSNTTQAARQRTPLSTPARRRLLAVLALGFLALPACADPADSRGTLVSADPIADLDLNVEQIGQYLTEFGLDPAAAHYAVKTFQYVYRTVDTSGEPTIASGLLALPATGDDRELPLVTWLHGTRVYRGEVASVDANHSLKSPMDAVLQVVGRH